MYLSGSTLSSLTKWSPLLSLKAIMSYTLVNIGSWRILTELTQKVPPRSMQIFTLSLTGAGMIVKLMDVT